MNNKTDNAPWGIVLIAGIAFGFGVAVGFGYGIRSASPHPSEEESAREQNRNQTVSIQRPRPLFRREESSIQTEVVDEDVHQPTPEERAAIGELARRVRAGEYVLASENPYILRMRRESLLRTMEHSVPRIMAAREDFLSTLGADRQAIARLTNHAARIAEASSTLSPLLEEVSAAKAQYELNARELLTPEQYEQFRDFELRQSLEQEWMGYEIPTATSLSLADLKALARSLDDLGIRERPASTLLPFEPVPSSGNWISPEQMNLDEIFRTKISRFEAAAADFEVIAERNQLSWDARRALAEMIDKRTTLLREQMERHARSAHRDEAQIRARYGLGRMSPD